MKRVVVSIIVSAVLGVVVGVVVKYLFFEDAGFATIVISSLAYAMVINLLFFYIRRWDGCIEKLGGATFTFFVLLLTIIPHVLLMEFEWLLVLLACQVVAIGIVATHCLRTTNFTPPKPGERLRW